MQQLSRTARILAYQLSRALALIFSSSVPVMNTATNVSNPDHITFETRGQAENDRKAREGRFTDIFIRALKLRAELLASTDQYEMVIPTPGTALDGRDMDEYVDTSSSGINCSGRPAEVEICILPSFYRYPQQNEIVGGRFLFHSIDYQNFLRNTSSEDRQSEVMCISRPLVILKDDSGRF